MRGQDFGAPFSATATGTQRATATKAAIVGSIHYVTEISVSADCASLGTSTGVILSQGSTTLWQDQLDTRTGTSVSVYLKTFNVPISTGSANASVSVTVGTAQTVATANIAGYTL